MIYFMNSFYDLFYERHHHHERQDGKFLHMRINKSFLNFVNLNQVWIVYTLFQQIVNTRWNRLENISIPNMKIHNVTSDRSERVS